jgi:DNA-binding CsgD family transcriptional regulator
VLVDRKAECEAIDRLLDGARRGSSAVLVLRGPPGIGKSTLLDYAAAEAGGFAISRITGVESEVALGFAAIHQLLLPFFDGVGELPDPQRHALETVFGLADHGPPDSLLVFLAVLTLLDNAAREQPTLLVIDDAQWLDDESARVLTFVARRLHADPVVMLFAVRDPGTRPTDIFDPLPQLDVGGLPSSDARQLLEWITGGPLDSDVADRLVEQTQGNPLALTEIARELSGEQLRGQVRLPEHLPVARSLQDQFVERIRLLSPAGQTLLLLASAERMGDPALLHRAASAMDVPWEEAIANIEAAGLAAFTPMVRFRHPLVRSAAYHAASATQRRQAHRALAHALHDEDDIDRRAWHLAAAAAAPDEDVARELEAAAGRVFGRGGIQAATEFLLRASDLTPDAELRVDRLLHAVRVRAAEGDAARAQPLLNAVLTRVHVGRQRAEAVWTQGLIWLGEGRAREAVRVLARAVASIERYDDGFPLDALIAAEDAILYAGRLGDRSSRALVATTARRFLPEGDPLSSTELLVRGVAIALLEGWTTAAPTVRDGLTRLRQEAEQSGSLPSPKVPERGVVLHLLAVSAAACVFDDAALRAVSRSWVEFGERTRALATLPIALDITSVCEILAGRFRAAESAIAEAEGVLSLVGARGLIGEPGLGQLLLHAYRGEEEGTRAVAQERTADAHERGSGVDLDFSHYALAMLELGSGRYEAALEHCRRIDLEDPFPPSTLALPTLIESALRCDDLVAANAAFARLSQRARASGTDWSQGLVSGMRALLAPDEDAEQFYLAALEQLTRCTVTFDRARAQLLYGEWLRRVRRRRDARPPLREALDFFEGIDARTFAERARRELAATGEHSRPRSDTTRDLLTPQEAEIARLVAEGKTNADIASQLFISRSTVEYHLGKIYRKAGVTSRTQLARLELRR